MRWGERQRMSEEAGKQRGRDTKGERGVDRPRGGGAWERHQESISERSGERWGERMTGREIVDRQRDEGRENDTLKP